MPAVACGRSILVGVPSDLMGCMYVQEGAALTTAAVQATFGGHG